MRSSGVDNLSLILQALSLQILFQDYNNSDLMKELQNQDMNYFQKILQNQETIITLLRKEETDGRKVNRKD